MTILLWNYHPYRNKNSSQLNLLRAHKTIGQRLSWLGRIFYRGLIILPSHSKASNYDNRIRIVHLWRLWSPWGNSLWLLQVELQQHAIHEMDWATFRFRRGSRSSMEAYCCLVSIGPILLWWINHDVLWFFHFEVLKTLKTWTSSISSLMSGPTYKIISQPQSILTMHSCTMIACSYLVAIWGIEILYAVDSLVSTVIKSMNFDLLCKIG